MKQSKMPEKIVTTAPSTPNINNSNKK